MEDQMWLIILLTPNREERRDNVVIGPLVVCPEDSSVESCPLTLSCRSSVNVSAFFCLV